MECTNHLLFILSSSLFLLQARTFRCKVERVQQKCFNLCIHIFLDVRFSSPFNQGNATRNDFIFQEKKMRILFFVFKLWIFFSIANTSFMFARSNIWSLLADSWKLLFCYRLERNVPLPREKYKYREEHKLNAIYKKLFLDFRSVNIHDEFNAKT